jgi:hypothetical protein
VRIGPWQLNFSAKVGLLARLLVVREDRLLLLLVPVRCAQLTT